MNRSRPRRAAARRGRSREESQERHEDPGGRDQVQQSQRGESNGKETPNDEPPPRRSARAKTDVRSPSQTTLTSFFGPRNKDGADEPHHDESGQAPASASAAADIHDNDASQLISGEIQQIPAGNFTTETANANGKTNDGNDHHQASPPELEVDDGSASGTKNAGIQDKSVGEVSQNERPETETDLENEETTARQTHGASQVPMLPEAIREASDATLQSHSTAYAVIDQLIDGDNRIEGAAALLELFGGSNRVPVHQQQDESTPSSLQQDESITESVIASGARFILQGGGRMAATGQQEGARTVSLDSRYTGLTFTSGEDDVVETSNVSVSSQAEAASPLLFNDLEQSLTGNVTGASNGDVPSQIVSQNDGSKNAKTVALAAADHEHATNDMSAPIPNDSALLVKDQESSQTTVSEKPDLESSTVKSSSQQSHADPTALNEVLQSSQVTHDTAANPGISNDCPTSVGSKDKQVSSGGPTIIRNPPERIQSQDNESGEWQVVKTNKALGATISYGQAPLDSTTLESQWADGSSLGIGDPAPVCVDGPLLIGPVDVSSSQVDGEDTVQTRRARTMSIQQELLLPTVSQAVDSDFPDVEEIKIRLYDAGSRVHLGKGPERRFAAYWDALSRFVGFRVQRRKGPVNQSSLDGLRKTVNSFLRTKQMRKLHNLLIMGLMEKCVKCNIIDDGIQRHVPEQWRERVRVQEVAKDPESKAMALIPLRHASDRSDLGLSCFGRVAEVWTACGKESLVSQTYVAALSSTDEVSSEEEAELSRRSSSLPGAVLVDPFVRGVVRDDGLKVSEPAVWLLVVAVREYVRSLLQDSISTLSSVSTDQSLMAIEFSQSAIGSGNLNKGKSEEIQGSEKGPAEQLTGNKRRRITPLDIAMSLDGSRMCREGSLAGSVDHVGYERCYSSFTGKRLSLPPELHSMQTFVANSMVLALKRPKTEWRNQEPLAAEDSKHASSASLVPDVPMTDALTTPHDKPTRSKSIRSPTGGLGKEPKNLAAMKARVAALAAAPAAAEPIPIAPAPSSFAQATIISDAQTSSQTGGTRVGDNEAAASEVRPASVDRERPPSIPPRGRGRGFGVKNLAAMRARSASSTPPAMEKDVTGSPSSSQQPGDGMSLVPSSNTAARTNSASPSAVRAGAEQNGSPSGRPGKELRHLERSIIHTSTEGFSESTGGANENSTTQTDTLPLEGETTQ